MRKIFSILTCLYFLVQGPLLADTDEDAISIRFSCLAWDTTKANGIQYLNGEEVVTLRVGQSNLNGPYAYTGANPIVFFREQPGEEPGTVVREPVARAYIEPGLRDVLFLFTENSSENARNGGATQPRFNVLVMNHNYGAFPMGSFRIINLSQHEVGCILGEEKMIIPAKQTKLVRSPAEDRADMRVHFSMKIDEQWEP
ncbi:MAG: hypothetical protein ACQKBT_10500, partial [Puniceicoccales bacterium]